MSMPETCERLFQLHKSNRYKVEWTKSTYDNEPDDLDAAKELMLEQGIIREGRDWQETKLNPALFDIDSYEEAKNILQSKSNQLGGSIPNYHVQQAGAVGSYSSAQNNTFNQLNQQLPADTNFEELKEKLEQLRKAIAGEADLPEHYAALAEIKKAEIALTKKNGSEVITSLKAAGKWIFDKGIDVGKEVLVAYIKSATGL